MLDRLTGEDGDTLRTLPYVPDLPLTVGGEPTRVAEIMHAARTVPFDFADRADLRKAAGPGVKIVTAACPDAPADALLVRPDGVVTYRGGDPAALREAMAAPGR
ncbi:hypothetical protein PV458_13590 [Streptomyces sp. MN03-5084-2B]|nr:hypothetical protein [Streptomyces sp. MN03-5084-2B]